MFYCIVMLVGLGSTLCNEGTAQSTAMFIFNSLRISPPFLFLLGERER